MFPKLLTAIHLLLNLVAKLDLTFRICSVHKKLEIILRFKNYLKNVIMFKKYFCDEFTEIKIKTEKK